MTRDVEVLRMWIRIVVVIAAISATSFPVVYLFSPWRSSAIGRVMMLLGVSLATAMDLTVLFMFWKPKNILVIFWVNALILTGLAVSTSLLTWMVWRMNYQHRKRVEIVHFASPVYDVLKRVAQIWLPAAGTLYFTLAQIWHLPAPEEVVGSVMAVDTFLGVLLGISSASYEKSGEKYDGTLTVEDNEDGSQLRLSRVDVKALAVNDEVTFKIQRTT